MESFILLTVRNLYFMREVLCSRIAQFLTLLLLANSSHAALVLQIGHKGLGASYGMDSFALPPDASLGVSTNHIVELINGRFTVFRRPTLGRLQSMTDLSFWSKAGITIPASGDVSDPRIVFDPVSARWFASMVDVD